MIFLSFSTRAAMVEMASGALVCRGVFVPRQLVASCPALAAQIMALTFCLDMVPGVNARSVSWRILHGGVCTTVGKMFSKNADGRHFRGQKIEKLGWVQLRDDL